jgi:CubicO group peptidase (beta-lactamase class C family)
MNKLRILALALGLSTICCVAPLRAAELPTAEPAEVGLSAEKLGEIDRIMDGFVKDRRIAGGIVLVARHGKVAFDEVYGVTDLETGQPLRRDTIFRIYSMTKAITSAAAMILRDEGKLDLDAPVADYLPEFKDMKVLKDDAEVPATKTMTVADLMRHTSGLIYGADKDDPLEKLYDEVDVTNEYADLALMTKKLGQLPLRFEPGEDWEYGVSIDVLGRVVEVVSGQPLDEFFRTRIFEPLGMTDTGFYVPPEKAARFAANYYSDDKGRMIIRDDPTQSRYLIKPRLLSGGGGLVGTASDYMRFLLMVAGGGELDGHRLLSPESVRLMTTNQTPKQAGWITFGDEVTTGVAYGLGFAVTVEPSEANPHSRVGQYGWGGLASTHYWVSPADELVVVTMEQRMPYSPSTEHALKPVIYGAIAQE